MNQQRIGIIGLGLMGTAMTRRLLRHEFEVHVWNRTQEEACPLLELGAQWSDAPIRSCDRVILSLYDSQSVEEVLTNMQDSFRENVILIDTTTGTPEKSVALSLWLNKYHIVYTDVPISGSSVQTENGEAVAIVGAEPEIFESCSDIFDVLVKKAIHVGAVGNGSKVKLVTNLVLGLNRIALSEGLKFAESIGLPRDAALQVLMESAASSAVMKVKGEKMIHRDFTPQAKLAQHLKDLKIIERLAKENGCPLPMTNTHVLLLEKAEHAGLGLLDNSAIIEVYDILKNRAETTSVPS